MTQPELRLACINAGLCCPTFLGAARYAQATRHWLLGPFNDYFRQQLFDSRLLEWSVRWECRDFARAFACFAQVANARTAGGDPASDALAVGELWYHPGADATKGHAINVAFVDDAPLFIEPQTGLCVTLTTAELSSAYFLRF